MNNKSVFQRTNFILLGISVFFICLGYLLMTGAESSFVLFDPAIFSKQRIVVAPIFSTIGYLLIIVAILYRPKNKIV